jgi:hemerythrin-like domain-containing protein
MDAITLLVADHSRVKGLVIQLREAQELVRTDAVARLAGQIFEELKVHTTVEEEVFYPAARQQSEELGRAVEEGIRAHDVLEALIEETSSFDPGSAEWFATLEVIIQNVERHVDEEEGDLFLTLTSATDAGWRNDLGDQIEIKKTELGAPTFAVKARMAKDDLLALAEAQRIPGRSWMDHEELAASVRPTDLLL